MSAKYILALDQGTTSSRAIVFDHDGHVRAQAQREFTQNFPQPGWVEHDAAEIWRSQLDVAREALGNSGIAAEHIAAIGITNQRETTILWDRTTGKPVHNAIVWQDRRTSAMCDDLRAAGHEGDITARTGLLLDPYFSATKLSWMLDHVPQARERANRGELAFGTVDAWLIWNLTGGRLHVTDASNASRTLFYNIHRQEWDDALLALFGIPRAVLPEVRSNSEIYAQTDARWFGIPLAIAGSAGDQQAATFGQACLSPGMAKNTYGTGCFMLMNTGAQAVPSSSRLLTTTLWQLDGRTSYALEGSVFMGGAIVQWLRDALGIIATSADVEGLAASVPNSAGVTLVPAFAGLGAPWWKPNARAALVGMTRGSTRAHIARAALDAIALQSADLLIGMERDAGQVGNRGLAELRVDGGAARNDLLMQIQADLLGVSVVRPRVTETTALGAAYLAGLAVNFWESQEAITAQWEVDKRFEPAISEAERQERLARWRVEVQKSI